MSDTKKCLRCNIPSMPGYFGWGAVINGQAQHSGVCFRCNGSNVDPGTAFMPRQTVVEVEHEEQEVDDSVNFCPNCEKPQQFSGACMACESDPDYQEYLERVA